MPTRASLGHRPIGGVHREATPLLGGAEKDKLFTYTSLDDDADSSSPQRPSFPVLVSVVLACVAAVALTASAWLFPAIDALPRPCGLADFTPGHLSVVPRADLSGAGGLADTKRGSRLGDPLRAWFGASVTTPFEVRWRISSSGKEGRDADVAYARWLASHDLSFDVACDARVPSGEEGGDGPFEGNQRVLMVGTAQTARLGDAIATQYSRAVTRTRGRIGPSGPSDGPDAVDCQCLSGAKTVDQCVAAGRRQARSRGVEAGSVQSSAGKEGRWENSAVSYDFRNGARMMVIANHYLSLEPIFGVDAAAAAFDTTLTDLDVVVVQEGPAPHAWEQLCKGTPGFKGVMDESNATMVSLRGVHGALKSGGFNGQMVALISEVDGTTGEMLKRRGVDEEAPFKVKVIPDTTVHLLDVPQAGTTDIQANIMLHALSVSTDTWG